MLSKMFGIIFICLTSYSCANLPIFKRNASIKNTSSLVLTGYDRNSYTKGNVEVYLNELKLLNANTATFLYSCQTKNLQSSNIDCSSSYTPSLESLEMAITAAKRQGFQVSVRHYIDIETKEWRCHWNPKDKKSTFTNIKRELVEFSQFLEEYKVESFTIGAEYCQLTTPSSKEHWQTIISSIRENFKGTINYGANWETIKGQNEFFQTPIWEFLDNIGLDYYSPIPDSVKSSRIYHYQKQKLLKFSNFAKRLKKPLFINEVGFSGSSKGTLEPYEWRNLTPGPEKRQANAYRETLQAIKSFDNIQGIFIWRKLAQNKNKMNLYGPRETGYALWKRKAWYEIQRFFKVY